MNEGVGGSVLGGRARIRNMHNTRNTCCSGQLCFERVVSIFADVVGTRRSFARRRLFL